MTAGRRRQLVPYIALALVAGVLPMAALMWISRERALRQSREQIERAVTFAANRVERIFSLAETTLKSLAEQTGGRMDEGTFALLQQTAYRSKYFREIGLIDENGFLVCTNLGPTEPPIPIKPEERSDPTIRSMQVLGVIDTELMDEHSIILSLPTIGEGEVNALIDPATLTDPLEQTALGPDGVIFVAAPGNRVLAVMGALPEDTVGLLNDKHWIHLTSGRNRFGVEVSASISREWALHHWYSDLFFIGPLGIAGSVFMAIIVLRLGARPSSMQNDLRRALGRNEFEAHYQPIIDLESGGCIGAEALIRWHHPVDGAVRPDVFIAVAEETGLIEPITEWLIDRVAKDLGELLRSREDLHIGINLAPSHFNTRAIVDVLQRILRPYQIPLNRFVLEATERGMVEDIGLSREVMDELRALGMRIAIDDFGVGYSSLAALQAFRFDILKIDASFVRRIGSGSVSAGVIDAIIELGQTLKVRLIAEGVEKPRQLEFLKARGVGAAQGWLFAKAMPAADFIEYLRAQAIPTSVAASNV